MDAKQLMDRMGAAGLMKLMPLQSKRIEDLTRGDLELVAQTLKIDTVVSRELFGSAVALMKGEGIHKAADLIQSPETVTKLVQLLSNTKQEPEESGGLIIQCPHCMKFFFEQPQQ
jgi:hypothetical protein